MVEERRGRTEGTSRIAKSHVLFYVLSVLEFFLQIGSAVQLGSCDSEYACKVPEESKAKEEKQTKRKQSKATCL